MSDIMSYLFETKAVRFCEENKPFWYTSGKIGPYFINTHFVYGSEKDASELLAFIDECLKDKASLPEKVFQKVLKQYNENEIYRKLFPAIRRQPCDCRDRSTAERKPMRNTDIHSALWYKHNRMPSRVRSTGCKVARIDRDNESHSQTRQQRLCNAAHTPHRIAAWA